MLHCLHISCTIFTQISPTFTWGNDPWTFCIWVMNIITIMIIKDFCQESLLATRFARCSWISKCYVCHVEKSPVTIYTDSFRGESRSSSFWDDAMNQWVVSGKAGRRWQLLEEAIWVRITNHVMLSFAFIHQLFLQGNSNSQELRIWSAISENGHCESY